MVASTYWKMLQSPEHTCKFTNSQISSIHEDTDDISCPDVGKISSLTQLVLFTYPYLYKTIYGRFLLLQLSSGVIIRVLCCCHGIAANTCASRQNQLRADLCD